MKSDTLQFGRRILRSAPSPISDEMSNDSGLANAPVFPLDQIRHAGLPLGQQISPYLQVDPSIFRNSEPQYILPEGASPKRGRLELAFGQIGGAVGGGYLLGMVRGTLPELRKNQDYKVRALLLSITFYSFKCPAVNCLVSSQENCRFLKDVTRMRRKLYFCLTNCEYAIYEVNWIVCF